MIALNRLTDEELFRHARNEQDRLVSSDLEIELLARLEKLIDRPNEDALANFCGYASEASAQFPEEDFLESVIEDVMELQDCVSGNRISDTKQSLQEIIEKLEELQKTIFGQTEYGREQLEFIINPEA